jgi:DNA modification methylase
MRVRMYCGDALDVVQTLPDESVHCVVTSPPYWGLRDYGVPGQLGLEPSPDLYVERLVEIFRETRRALHPAGTLWLNIGDCYTNSDKGGYAKDRVKAMRSNLGANFVGAPNRQWAGLGPKNLVGVPWRLAFALQADGWWLREDIIWQKPNPMPESVTDRCTRAHEYLFHFAKSERYYHDADAIAEPITYGDHARNGNGRSDFIQQVPGQAKQSGITKLRRSGNKKRDLPNGKDGRGIPNDHLGRGIPWNDPRLHRPQFKRAMELAREAGLTQAHVDAIRASGVTGDGGKLAQTATGAGRNTKEVVRLAKEAKAALGGYWREFLIDAKRNARSVWTINVQPFTGAHFATFPAELARRCVIAGSRPGETVLDPFGGSGTVGQVATGNGRNSIYIDLNPDYVELAKQRIGPMLCEVA